MKKLLKSQGCADDLDSLPLTPEGISETINLIRRSLGIALELDYVSAAGTEERKQVCPCVIHS